jgi:hypothetical protein
MQPSTPLLDFYRGQGTDAQGRTLEEILRWHPRRLESVHDYIQWLFPLPAPSTFNPQAPILDDEEVSAFRQSKTLRQRLLNAFELMLGFYGYRRQAGGNQITIRPSDNFSDRANNWLTPGNHNHLRISRILESLTHLGRGQDARAWLAVLEATYQDHRQVIGPVTLDYWRRAVNT